MSGQGYSYARDSAAWVTGGKPDAEATRVPSLGNDIHNPDVALIEPPGEVNVGSVGLRKAWGRQDELDCIRFFGSETDFLGRRGG